MLAGLAGYAFARRGSAPSHREELVVRAARERARRGARSRGPEEKRLNALPRAEGARKLWQRAVALLEAGDLAGAEHAFRRVVELPTKRSAMWIMLMQTTASACKTGDLSVVTSRKNYAICSVTS